jgi:hypothetical protein
MLIKIVIYRNTNHLDSKKNILVKILISYPCFDKKKHVIFIINMIFFKVKT